MLALLHRSMLNTANFFECLFNNARQNAMLIMNEDGIIGRINEAFAAAYGYNNDDLNSKHFRILFIEKDQINRKPEIELNTVFKEGSAIDENYLVHKDGTPIWVTGESVLIKTEDRTAVVKIIHNIHAQKQLERYLLDSSELLDSLFESVQQSGLLLLSTQMKTIKANRHFKKMFNLDSMIPEGCRLQEIGHPFWTKEEIKNDIRNAIVNSTTINKEYLFKDKTTNPCHVRISSKLVVSEDSEKRLLLMIKEQ